MVSVYQSISSDNIHHVRWLTANKIEVERIEYLKRLPMPKVYMRGHIDPPFVRRLFITSQMCLSSSTAPSVTRKIIGTEPRVLDNISTA